MRVKSLRLKNFRNFDDIQVNFADRLNIFIGQNGQGKSNLLEAITLLILNDSFRYADNDNLIKFNQTASNLDALLENNGLDYHIKLQVLKSRKHVTWNDKKVSHNSIRQKFSCVVFSPESLSFIKEASDERRSLVDEAVISVDPLGDQIVGDFKKALKTRNKILRDFSEGLTSKNQVSDLLASLEPIYVRLATALTTTRLNLLRNMHQEIQESMQFISKKPVDISVEYLISRENHLNRSPEEVNDAIRQRLSELRDAELASGTSLVGPHKHEIVFLYDQKDSRFYCSQGQQRALILSFKMAQIVYHRRVHGTFPILLLDDVLSELDVVKRGALIEFLHNTQTQIFLTTTDLHLPEEMNMSESKVFEVKEGRIL